MLTVTPFRMSIPEAIICRRVGAWYLRQLRDSDPTWFIGVAAEVISQQVLKATIELSDCRREFRTWQQTGESVEEMVTFTPEMAAFIYSAILRYRAESRDLASLWFTDDDNEEDDDGARKRRSALRKVDRLVRHLEDIMMIVTRIRPGL